MSLFLSVFFPFIYLLSSTYVRVWLQWQQLQQVTPELPLSGCSQKAQALTLLSCPGVVKLYTPSLRNISATPWRNLISEACISVPNCLFTTHSSYNRRWEQELRLAGELRALSFDSTFTFTTTDWNKALLLQMCTICLFISCSFFIWKQNAQILLLLRQGKWLIANLKEAFNLYLTLNYGLTLGSVDSYPRSFSVSCKPI